MKTYFDKKIALAQFKKRKLENAGKQIDNSKLYAGSPMHYYCKFCGAPTEVLQELHVKVPKTICDPCKVLNDNGLL